MIRLFLDDERFPPEKGEWVIVRTFYEAVNYCYKRGCPVFISLDHDLGEDTPTGYDFAKWLVEQDMNSDGEYIPVDFTFYVHSQNPVGAENIKKYLNNYLEHRRVDNG